MKNPYKEARLRAAKKNDVFKSVQNACDRGAIYIPRERLLRIEQTDPKKKTEKPTPDDVIQMAAVYSAPELLNYYCTSDCPIGEMLHKEELEHNDINRIYMLLSTSTHGLEQFRESLYKLFADGKITEDEKKDLAALLSACKKVAYSADSLELWAIKNGLLDKDWNKKPV